MSNKMNAVEIETVQIPGGTFLMGSPGGVGCDDERPQHQVTIAPFQIGKYPVTQAQYQAVMGSNPSYFKGDDLPVESVSWNDAQEFCRKLSEQTGNQYRLPTEAEWEYACRAGGDGQEVPPLYGWFLGNSDGKTHPVGQKKPNAFGVYDMHGNVWEWCDDEWHDNYSGAPTDGSSWSGDSPYRILRGGSWVNVRSDARAVYRNGNRPANRIDSVGFRVVSCRPPSDLESDGALAPNVAYEIPAAMLDAATSAVEGVRYDRGIGFMSSAEIAKTVIKAAGVPELLARIAELEADTHRLRWLMDNSGIDGFYGVVNDRYDFAVEWASEAGHSEPSKEDEFNGWRRLIDAAMRSAGGASE